jgi:peptide/nickel transport system permease protein
MWTYALRRLGYAVPTLIGVVLVAFGILYAMPGDPVALLVANAPGGSDTSVAEAAIRTRFGLDQPIYVQFYIYLRDMLHGDFGTSILQDQPVSELFFSALPHTLELAGSAFLLSILIGIPVGVISAMHRNTWLDRGSIFASLLAISFPEFWMAIFAIRYFAVELQILPAFGTGGIEYLIMPATVLGIRASAALARITRSSMLDVLNRQYVTTARAKGLSESRVVTLHALRNALAPVVTLLGLELGRLISGAVVVETIFNRDGIGKLLIQSVLDKDIPVLRTTVLFVAVGYIFINLLVDLSYAWLNPRIRYGAA